MNLSNIPNLDQAIIQNRLLVAQPFMDDHIFRRAVVVVCEHNKEGSFGFILNKPLDMKINQLLATFPPFDAPAFIGGPVQTDTLHYIHTAGEILEGSHKIRDGIYWGGDYNALKRLVKHQLITPRDIRFFVGYTGWGAGQLVEEMQAHSWIIADLDPNYLFSSRPQNDLWATVLQHKGDAFAVLAEVDDTTIHN